jgi:hypothetical protein
VPALQASPPLIFGIYGYFRPDRPMPAKPLSPLLFLDLRHFLHFPLPSPTPTSSTLLLRLRTPLRSEQTTLSQTIVLVNIYGSIKQIRSSPRAARCRRAPNHERAGGSRSGKA